MGGGWETFFEFLRGSLNPRWTKFSLCRIIRYTETVLRNVKVNKQITNKYTIKIFIYMILRFVQTKSRITDVEKRNRVMTHEPNVSTVTHAE